MFETEDITPYVGQSNSTPDEAANNIKGAKELNVTPDGFKDMKSAIEPQLRQDRAPAEAPKAVARHIAKSSEHSALLTSDSDFLSTASKYVSYIGDTIEGKDLNREMSNLQYKKAIGYELSEEDEFKILELNDQINKLGVKNKDRGFTESIPAEMAGLAYDLGLGLWEQKGVIAAGTLGTAAVQAAIGSFAGPAGTVVGATTGFLQGGAFSLGVAFINDTYEQGTGQVYNELTYGIGEDLKLPESEKRSIAIGAGLMMGGVSVISARYLPKQIPWVNKITSPKAFVNTIRAAGGDKWLNLAKSLGKSFVLEGGEEATQEVIQIYAEKLAKSFDGQETSFTEALLETIKDKNTYPRAGKAGALGGIAGAGFVGINTVAGEIVGANTVRAENIEVPKVKVDETLPTKVSDIIDPASKIPSVIKGTRAVHVKLAIDKIRENLIETNTQKFAPDEMNELVQTMFEEQGMSEVYVDKDEFNAWANTNEKAQAARSILNKSAATDATLNAPIKFQMSEFFKLITEFEDASSLVKVTPDSPSFNEYIAKVEEAKLNRDELLKTAPEPTQVDLLNEYRIKDKEIFNESDYMSQPTFTESMYKGLPEKEITSINEAQTKAREEVVKAINSYEEKQINRLSDIQTETQLLFEKEAYADTIDSNEDINFIEAYLNPEVIAGESISGKEPIHQIDPESLTPRLRSQFLEDPVLKERKVFSKTGKDIQAVSRLFNRKPQDLLKTLSEVPTREQALENMTESLRQEIESESRADVRSDMSRLSKAYNNMTRNHLKELKFMLTNEWSSFKSGVKRIAFDLPRFEEISIQAKENIGSTRVADLNATKWKVSERKSQRKAMNAILQNKQEVAFREKQNAALATQMAKETHIAFAKLNNANKFVASLLGNRNQAVLREAGPIYLKPIDDIMSVITFDRSNKGQIKLDNFIKYAEKQIADGNGDVRIHPEVLDWLSEVDTAKNLTVDQYLYFVDKMRTVLKQAKLKNKLLGKYQDKQVQLSLDVVREAIKTELREHPDYDEKRLTENQGERPIGQRVSEWIDNFNSLFTNNQFISLRLDQGKVNGTFSKFVYQALEGIGEHEGAYGRTAKRKWQAVFNKKFNEEINKYGKKEFKRLGVTKVKVKQFSGIEALNNGNLRKVDLLTMLMHMGNIENRSRLENFGVDSDTIMSALKEYLTEKDFDFVQNAVWNMFRGIAPKLQALEKLTKGVELDLVEATPFEAFGKVYEGGYMPLIYAKETNIDAVTADVKKRNAATIEDGSQTFIPDASSEGIVRSPHTKSRIGSDWQVSLDFNTLSIGFEQVIHDLSMRVPVRDVMALITDKEVAKDISSVLGPKVYKLYVNTVAEQTKSITAETGKLYLQQNKTLSKFFDQVEAGLSVAYISFNPSSVLMSSLGTPSAINIMGAKGKRHVSAAALKVLHPANYNKLNEVIKFATEIDPSLIPHYNGLEEFNSKALPNIINPTKRLFTNKPYNLLADARDKAVHISFNEILGNLDAAQKTVVAVAAYSQYMAGDAPGHSLDSVMRMSELQRHQNAKAYAAQISNASLIAAGDFDKAAIQKSDLGKRLVRFWNEQRSALNQRIQNARNLKYNSKKAVAAAKRGDFLSANLAMQDSSALVARVMLMSMLSTYIIKTASNIGRDEEYQKEVEPLDLVYGLPAEMVGNHIPLVRDFIYSTPDELFSGAKTRGISLPFLQGVQAVGESSLALSRSVLDTLQIIDSGQELSDREFKAMMQTVSILAGGIPVNGPLKVYKEFESGDPDDIGLLPMIVGGAYLGVKEGFEYFIQKYDESKDIEGMSDEEIFKQLEEDYNNKSKSGLQQAVDQVKDLVASFTQPTKIDPLDDDGYQMMSKALSGDSWSKIGDKGETGIYQFSESKWQAIMNNPRARDLGLTENGRVSKDQTQQNKAMRFEMKRLSSELAALKVPVNPETLLFAHMFDTKRTQSVYTASRKTKLKRDVRNDSRVKKNKIKTVGQMQDYIKELLNN